MSKKNSHKVSIVMGSQSDFKVMKMCQKVLKKLKIKYDLEIKIRKGKYRCIKFCPVVQKGRIFKTEEDLQVWISDDENKIPLLAKANILVGSIKMELTKHEGVKNPISKIK